MIYNGIDPAPFTVDRRRRRASLRLQLALSPDAKIVGTVGRLDSIKDHTLLLKSFARDASPNTHLVLIGGGPEQQRLEALSRQLSLSGTANQPTRVHFLGMRRDVAQLLPGFDVFALSSLSEGTPMTILEAMAASVPVVSTAVGGVSEILTNNVNALLVAPPREPIDAESSDRPEEFVVSYAGALKAALYDDDLAARLTKNAHQHFDECFHLDAITERYRKIYADLLPASVSSTEVDPCPSIARS